MSKKKQEEETPQETAPPTQEDQIAELTDTLKRLQAEFENFKKRTEAESQRRILQGHQSVVAKLLPTLDDFERAMQHDDKEGYKHIFTNLQEMLADQGVKKIDSLNKPFNPSYHEALMVDTTQDKAKDNTISEVFSEGYSMGEQVLRHAKVKVYKYNEEESKQEEEE